jgi:hypothetical protein
MRRSNVGNFQSAIRGLFAIQAFIASNGFFAIQAFMYSIERLLRRCCSYQ